MAEYQLIAMTSPVKGREDEFNVWYNDIHLKDVLKVPGIKSARRFRNHKPAVVPGQPPHRYLAFYEVETDDIEATIRELRSRPNTPKMTMSGALDTRTSILWVVEAISPKLVSE
jgi:hypothetical protein